MSDRLAVSATLSVLIMAIYVLFGADSARAPLGSENLASAASVTAPAAAELAPGAWKLLR